MADDTRLAEACLLLNYSSQSYREQMTQAKSSTQEKSNESAAVGRDVVKIEPIECDQLVEKTVSSKLITPPPENEIPSAPAEEFHHENETSIASDDCIGLSGREINPAVDASGHESAWRDYAASDRSINYSYTNYHDVNREPIHNLLAAVNCALPGYKSRPTILQRSSTTHASLTPRPLSSSCPPNVPDHDYCQPDQSSTPLSSSSSSSTSNHNQRESTGFTRMIIKQEDTGVLSQEISYRADRSDNRNRDHHLKRKQKHANSIDSSYASKKPLKLVAVHLGAGNSHNATESLQLAKLICEEVMLQTSAPHLASSPRKRRKTSSYSNSHDSLAQFSECRGHSNMDETEGRMSAEMAVVQLVKRMEDHQALNCGYGSNLNIKGQVECDASLMSDRTQMWAGVGAVSGCKNPILLAKSLYDHRTIPRPLGLIQPNILVGSGAKQWMREHCPHLSIMDSKMVSSRSFSIYQKLKSKYDAAVRSLNNHPDTGTVFVHSRPSDGRLSPVRHGKRYTNGNPRERLIYSSPTHAADGDTNLTTTTRHNTRISDHEATSQESQATAAHSSWITATSLDHGFYCITTRDNLKKVPSFARAIHKVKEFENRADCVQTDDQQIDPSSSSSPPPSVELRNSQGTSSDKDIEFHLINSSSSSPSLHYKLDTVGAIAVDSDNNFASAISSGGLLLKYKGRIGQAAIPGAGCWSEDSVAVTTTGVGEYLTLNMFARKFYDKMLTLRLLYDLGHVERKPDLSGLISCGMDECFEDLMRSPALSHVAPHERLAGMLSVSSLSSKGDSARRGDDRDLYLSYAHNTSSMCIGYMTCNDIVGRSVVSRRIGEKDSSRAVVKTMKFSLDPSKHVDNYFDNGSDQL